MMFFDVELCDQTVKNINEPFNNMKGQVSCISSVGTNVEMLFLLSIDTLQYNILPVYLFFPKLKHYFLPFVCTGNSLASSAVFHVHSVKR